jgi:hypothetical protein
MGSLTSPVTARHQVSGPWHTDLPMCRPTPLPRDNHRPVELPSCVTPSACLLPDRPAAPPPPRRRTDQPLTSPGSAWAVPHGYGNINPLSIDYACRPRLRPRLTLGGLACPRNPWSFGGRASHPSFATHACILTRVTSTAGLPRCFTRHTTLPYPAPPQGGAAAASAACLSPVTLSARNHLTSELLRTLSRVAASKPTSWLSVQLHILSHLARA